jgi:hypothetical protein
MVGLLLSVIRIEMQRRQRRAACIALIKENRGDVFVDLVPIEATAGVAGAPRNLLVKQSSTF